MSLDDDEQRTLADIERHLNQSDPHLSDALQRSSPGRRRPTAKISAEQAIAAGLALAWLAAVFTHHGLLALALIPTVAGIWLACRHADGGEW